MRSPGEAQREKKKRGRVVAACHPRGEIFIRDGRDLHGARTFCPRMAAVSKPCTPPCNLGPLAIYPTRPGQLCGERRRICDSARGTRSRSELCSRVCSRNGLVKGNLSLLSGIGPAELRGPKENYARRGERKKWRGQGEGVTGSYVSA